MFCIIYALYCLPLTGAPNVTKTFHIDSIVEFVLRGEEQDLKREKKEKLKIPKLIEDNQEV